MWSAVAFRIAHWSVSCRDVVSSNPSGATAIHGLETMRAKMAVNSEWEGRNTVSLVSQSDTSQSAASMNSCMQKRVDSAFFRGCYTTLDLCSTHSFLLACIKVVLLNCLTSWE